MDHLRALIVLVLVVFSTFAQALPDQCGNGYYCVLEGRYTTGDAARAACGQSAYDWTPWGTAKGKKFISSIPGYPTYSGMAMCVEVSSCPAGEIANASGKCVPPPPKCKPTQKVDASTNKCVPECPLRQSKDASGACVADTPPTAGSMVPSNADNGRPGELGSDNSGVTSNQNLPGGTGCVGGWEFSYDGAVCTPPDGTGNYNCINYGSRYTGNTCESEEITPPAGSATQCLSPAVPNGSSCSCPAGYTAGSITVGTSTQVTCAPSTGTGTGTGGTGTGTGGTGTGTGGTGTGGTGTGTDNGGGGTDPGTGGTGTGGTGTGTGTDPGTGSYNSVDCGVSPICSGDAVQCGISLEAWRTHCKLGEIHQKGAYDALMDGAVPGGSAADIAAGNKALNKDGLLDWDVLDSFQKHRQAYFNYASACPGLQTIQVFSQSITLDSGAVCEFGRFIRLILHLCAYLIVIRIIQRTMT
ncbi:hypothetical protein ACLSSQ_09145 [Azospira sp. APE16]|uniref:hypothetical protein n=2 Tax=Azospira TaxID=146937 RepID=UPI003A4E02C5